VSSETDTTAAQETLAI